MATEIEPADVLTATANAQLLMAGVEPHEVYDDCVRDGDSVYLMRYDLCVLAKLVVSLGRRVELLTNVALAAKDFYEGYPFHLGEYIDLPDSSFLRHTLIEAGIKPHEPNLEPE